MFDALVPEYDRFNRFSSLGLDISWRREAVALIPENSRVLDVGTGTGDMARLLLEEKGCEVVGVDFSPSMVQAARRKLGNHPKARFDVARADELPFPPKEFDGLTSAFLIRNLHHGEVLPPSLREFFRVLKPGGQMVHLELTRPTSRIMSMGHRIYLDAVLPMIGRALFGERWPRQYLSNTIEQFPTPQSICQKFRWAGFERVCHYPMSFGIASLFVGVRC